MNLVIDQNDFQKENSIKVYAIYDSAIGLDVEKTIYCKKETPNESENKIKPSKRSLSAEENPGVKCNELMKATCGHKKKACISQSCKHSCCHRDSKNKILKNSMDSSGKETVHQSCSQKHPVIEESSESDKRNSIVEVIEFINNPKKLFLIKFLKHHRKFNVSSLHNSAFPKSSAYVLLSPSPPVISFQIQKPRRRSLLRALK